MANKETNIQTQIRLELSKTGVCLRTPSGLYYTKQGTPIKVGQNGQPDLIYVGPGLIMFLEVKVPGGHRRPEQIKFQEMCKEYNAPHAFVDSVENALEEVEKWKNNNH